MSLANDPTLGVRAEELLNLARRAGVIARNTHTGHARRNLTAPIALIRLARTLHNGTARACDRAFWAAYCDGRIPTRVDHAQSGGGVS